MLTSSLTYRLLGVATNSTDVHWLPVLIESVHALCRQVSQGSVVVSYSILEFLQEWLQLRDDFFETLRHRLLPIVHPFHLVPSRTLQGQVIFCLRRLYSVRLLHRWLRHYTSGREWLNDVSGPGRRVTYAGRTLQGDTPLTNP